MAMFHLAGAPHRAPYSDWCAQIERLLAKQGVTLDRTSPQLHACYDVGLSPRDVADDWDKS